MLVTDTVYSISKFLWTFYKDINFKEYVGVLSWIYAFFFSAISGWLIWLFLIYHCIKGYTQLINKHFFPSDFEHVHPEVSFASLVSYTIIIISYQLYWWFDRGAEHRGGHPVPILRKLGLWWYLRDYFPIKLHFSSENIDQMSDPTLHTLMIESFNTQDTSMHSNYIFRETQNYLVGYHPHGIFGVGALVNFMTEANSFSKKLPGLTPWIVTLELNFKSPFQRDLLLSMNVVAASFESIYYLLDPTQCGKTGNFVIVVLGGAAEALDSRPGKYVFHTNKRFGFFKLALLTGSSLVPCVSFGEPNLYKQVWNPQGSKLRNFQEAFLRFATFSNPLFYNKMIVPSRSPINTVVGMPIPVDKIENPTRSQVSALKNLYLEELKKLFEKFKPIYDADASDVEYV